MLIIRTITKESIEVDTIYERKLCEERIRVGVFRKFEKVYFRSEHKLGEYECLFEGS